nr:ABC transporter ATP-binding protein [Roseburia sp. 1XD42-34]
MIQGKSVSKKVNNNCILDHIDFTFWQGEAVAIVGTNGSGKSTLLRLLTGISEPSSGTIQRGNCRIGYVPEQFSVNISFTGFDYLYHLGRIEGLSRETSKKRTHQLLEQFGLQATSKAMKLYSKGMRQKINIMQALLHSPSLLILDEPLSGLDNTAQLEVESILHELKEKGLTIIFTCHDHLLLKQLADRTLQLRNGKFTEVTETILATKENTVTIETTLPADCLVLKQFDNNPKINAMQILANKVIFKVHPLKSDEMILQLIQAGVSIISVTQIRQIDVFNNERG